MLQTKRRFWQTAGLSGSARTDRATETWDAAFDLPASRGILGATTGGELERRIQGMTREASVASASISSPMRFPAIRSEFEKGAVYRWSTDPWARGAFALYRPGQMTELLPRSRRRKTACTSPGSTRRRGPDGWKARSSRASGPRAKCWQPSAGRGPSR